VVTKTLFSEFCDARGSRTGPLSIGVQPVLLPIPLSQTGVWLQLGGGGDSVSADLVYMVPGRCREGTAWTVVCVTGLGSDGNLGLTSPVIADCNSNPLKEITTRRLYILCVGWQP
jgi:hypothetical protein